MYFVSIQEFPKSLLPLRDGRPFINSSEISAAPVKYVAWLDLMGSTSIMTRSMAVSASFLGKLHSAALQSKTEMEDADDTPLEDLRIYPVVDGLYITCTNQTPLLRFLKKTISRCAFDFIFARQELHKFMVRGSICLGPVVEGAALCTKSHFHLKANPAYAEHILFGPPVAIAYKQERLAAPFGIYVDASIRVVTPPERPPLTYAHWRWWKLEPRTYDEDLAAELYKQLIIFLEWCHKCNTWVLYDREAIARHTDLVRQYFDSGLPSYK
jgi:hypothetical protein